MAYPPPPTTPPVPQRGDRATFSSRVDAFLTWIASIIPWLQGFVADTKASLSTLAAGGANSFSYVFDSATADTDPGPGKLRIGSATQNTATVIRIDDLTADNVSIASFLAGLISGNSSIKGALRIQKVNDPSAWILYDITASAGTGYKNLTVIPRASTGATPFSNGDQLSLFFDRNGDSGVPGVLELVGGATITTAVSNIDFLNIFSDNYEKYIVEVVGVTPSVTNGGLQLYLTNEAGAIITQFYEGTNTGLMQVASGGVIGQRAGRYCNVTLEFNAVRSSAEFKSVNMRGYFIADSNNAIQVVSTTQINTSTTTKINGFRLNWSNGSNFTRGYIKIYGLKAI